MPGDDRIDAFLLLGQSNMAGRGRPGDVPALRDPRVVMFRDGRWIPAEEPLHTDKPDIAGIGLGMSFAVDLAADAPRPVGLVPCAVGGTPLRRWMPGADLYEGALATARRALHDSGLRGILWHQGEADAGREENARTYGARLETALRQLRDDLGADGVPVVVGELGHFLHGRPGSFSALVNRELAELARRLPACACVGAEDLGDNGDRLHFNSVALREFGRRYASAWRTLDAARATGAEAPPPA